MPSLDVAVTVTIDAYFVLGLTTLGFGFGIGCDADPDGWLGLASLRDSTELVGFFWPSHAYGQVGACKGLCSLLVQFGGVLFVFFGGFQATLARSD